MAAGTVVILMAAIGLAACGSSSSDSSSSSDKNPVTVQTGINDPKNRTIAVLQFMPATVTVKTGSTVRWDWTGTIEPHTVTFLPPGTAVPSPEAADPFFAPTPPKGPYDGKTLVNSGLQPLGPQPAAPLDVTFSTPGSYTYHCVIHPQMVGTVVVKDSGTFDTASSAKKRGDADQVKFLAEGQAAKTALETAAPKTTKNADGSTTFEVQMGKSTEHTDILQFAPTPASVKAGDKVEFLNDSGAPHTASFFGTTPAIVDPTDPKVSAPAPGPSPQTLNNTAFFNSGLLPPNAPPGAGPPPQARSFTFVVPAAGSYTYVCILHSPSGMGGTITAS